MQAQRLYPSFVGAASGAPMPPECYSPASQYSRSTEQMKRHCMPNGNFFSSIDDGYFQARAAEAVLVASMNEMKPITSSMHGINSTGGHTIGSSCGMLKPVDLISNTTVHAPSAMAAHMHRLEGMTDFFPGIQTGVGSMGNAQNPEAHHAGISMHPYQMSGAAQFQQYAAPYHAIGSGAVFSQQGFVNPSARPHNIIPPAVSSTDPEADPRELETFAEHFKQRRIKLGVTQADVGKALANLKLPGVGSLSQSTICRFESLTLSHNNMVALKPILEAWLCQAETAAKIKRKEEAEGILNHLDRKRKRTSIAAPEKRHLEAFFRSNPRPSGEKISLIADQLELKKNVVRVWFCNQRQKQKRLKFVGADLCGVSN